MNPLTKYIGLAAVVLILALGGASYFLFREVQALNKQMGELKESNSQLQAALNAKSNATRERAGVDQSIRRLAPADVIERLR